MHCCGEEDSSHEKEKDKEIARNLRNQRKTEQHVVKMVLLGAGDSGKSTIFKQLKIIHQSGFKEEDRKEMISVIHANIVQNIKDLVKGASKIEIQIPSELEADVQAVTTAQYQARLSGELVQSIKNIWKSQQFQEVFKFKSKFQLSDSAHYFFEKLDDIAKETYLPSDQDILRVRVRTSGIIETTFQIQDISFKICDVGGQRNERRKWIHCFENIHAVLFIVAISEYDQVLFEDETQNRLAEALTLFFQICNSDFFEQTSMILFLNKKDIFEEKLKVVDLSTRFADYTGGSDFNAAVEYITKKFLVLNKREGKKIYTHVTCATDTDNIRFVFEAVKDIILTKNLSGGGFT